MRTWLHEAAAQARDLHDSLRAVRAASGPSGAGSSLAGGKLDPHAVVEAFAEGMKSDNSNSQAAAGRAAALATKYSQRAF